MFATHRFDLKIEINFDFVARNCLRKETFRKRPKFISRTQHFSNYNVKIFLKKKYIRVYILKKKAYMLWNQ